MKKLWKWVLGIFIILGLIGNVGDTDSATNTNESMVTLEENIVATDFVEENTNATIERKQEETIIEIETTIQNLENESSKNVEIETDITTETKQEPTEAQTIPETEKQLTEAEIRRTNYVINTNTEKFHYTSCPSADDIKPSNRWDYAGTREEVINMGYVPCKRCNP